MDLFFAFLLVGSIMATILAICCLLSSQQHLAGKRLSWLLLVHGAIFGSGLGIVSATTPIPVWWFAIPTVLILPSIVMFGIALWRHAGQVQSAINSAKDPKNLI